MRQPKHLLFRYQVVRAAVAGIKRVAGGVLQPAEVELQVDFSEVSKHVELMVHGKVGAGATQGEVDVSVFLTFEELDNLLDQAIEARQLCEDHHSRAVNAPPAQPEPKGGP